MIDWSPQQIAAIEQFGQWYRNGCRGQVFRVFGYAGTGKTTLAQEFVKIAGGNVLFGAFTGKAAYVLRQRGCTGATTIHKMIYTPRDRSTSHLKQLHERIQVLRELDPANEEKIKNLERKLRYLKKQARAPLFDLNPDSPVRTANLVIIDECSMVDERMGLDLLSFGTPILVIGDTAQLPPVGGAGFFTNAKPDVLLTEIHRQAKGNPIIAIASAVRQSKPLKRGRLGDSNVVDWQTEMSFQQALEYDQILCGRNSSRRGTNKRIREVLGFTNVYPEEGDRLVCLKNNHEAGLLNGSQWRVLATGRHDADTDTLELELENEENGDRATCTAHAATFRGEEVPYWDRKRAEEFDFGYVLTVHKAQGSQWGSVLLFDESRVFRQEAQRWLYTGVTRAVDRITIAI